MAKILARFPTGAWVICQDISDNSGDHPQFQVEIGENLLIRLHQTIKKINIKLCLIAVYDYVPFIFVII